MTFPAAAIARLLNITIPTHGDTLVRYDFTLADMAALKALPGALYLSDQQNDAPSIGEFLEAFNEFTQPSFRFIGYIVFPPRSDARISIEGFETDVSGLEAEMLRRKYRKADELDVRLVGKHRWHVRAWWD